MFYYVESYMTDVTKHLWHNDNKISRNTSNFTAGSGYGIIRALVSTELIQTHMTPMLADQKWGKGFSDEDRTGLWP